MTLVKGPNSQEVGSSQLTVAHLNGMEIVFARTADGQAVAFENLCSHADRPLHKGQWDPQEATIQCPYHKAKFDILKGGQHVCPPAFSGIQVFPVEEREGHLWVDLS